jgi:hypothetical protein
VTLIRREKEFKFGNNQLERPRTFPSQNGNNCEIKNQKENTVYDAKKMYSPPLFLMEIFEYGIPLEGNYVWKLPGIKC